MPGDPARTGNVAFWRPDGAPPPAVAEGTVGDLTLVRPRDGGVEPATLPAVMLPVRAALPVLTRARASTQGHPTASWGATAGLALPCVAREPLLPGLSPTDHDAWGEGPLGAADVERIRRLAAAMPPEAHAVPLSTDEPLRLPDPEELLRAFLDAVADALPRSPAAPLVTGSPAYAAQEPQHVPEQRAWAADVAAGHDAGVRLSLLIEVRGPADGKAPGFRAVLQMHSVSDPTIVADAGDVWGGATAFGPHARMDCLLALRREARAWPPLAPLLSAAVPGAVELADEEITDLLGTGARDLFDLGVDVHWPRDMARKPTTRAMVGPPDDHDDRPTSDAPSFLSADALLAFDWSFALGDQRRTRQELDRPAEANRPVVRPRDQWVPVDPREVRRARTRQDHKVTPVDALGAALTGSAEVEGHRGRSAAHGVTGGPAGPAGRPGGPGAGPPTCRAHRTPAGLSAPGSELAGADDALGPLDNRITAAAGVRIWNTGQPLPGL